MKNPTSNNNLGALEIKSATIDILSPIVSKNIKTLLSQQNLTQKQLSEMIGITESTISYYIRGKSFPTFDFFLALKKEFGISIDDFITRNINPSDLITETSSNELEKYEQISYQKFCGTYFVYYFDTSKYKGRDYNTPEESLMFGILHIYETPTPVNKFDYSCIAILGITDRDKTDELKTKIEEFDNTDKLEEFINNNYVENAYYGDFELTHDHAFLTLTHGSKDKALIILHRPRSNKTKYKSGIGTINSVSKGRESMPVIQFIGISRDKINLSCEEIHRNLLLNYPSIKTNNYADELIKLVKNLYIDNNDNYEVFTETQKKITIKAELERYIRKSLETNMFRYGKISNRDDDDWYHALKEAAVFSSDEHASQY